MSFFKIECVIKKDAFLNSKVIIKRINIILWDIINVILLGN